MDELSEMDHDVLAVGANHSGSNVKSESGGDDGHGSGEEVEGKDCALGSGGMRQGGVGGAGDQIMLCGEVLSSSHVQGMKKAIDDLGLVNQSREKRIAEVRICICSLVCFRCGEYSIMKVDSNIF
jgi:hypothetical protein